MTPRRTTSDTDRARLRAALLERIRATPPEYLRHVADSVAAELGLDHEAAHDEARELYNSGAVVRRLGRYRCNDTD